MKKLIPTNKLNTRLLYVLDESGSMEDIKPSVISGFNEYIHGLQKMGNFTVTLTKFDSMGIRTPYSALPVKKVPKLNADTYSPGQMTPLYDACVEAIENLALEMTDGQPVLVAIQTDGLENASKHHTEKCLRNLIQKLQAKGNWSFVFMGANQDSWAVAQNLGIPQGNIVNWQATTLGTQNVFRGLAQNTAMYCMAMSENAEKGVALNTSNFVQSTVSGEKIK